MSKDDRAHMGAGGLEPKIDFTPMPSYGALHRLRREMHNIGDIQLPREVTLGQLFGFLVMTAVGFWVSSWFLDGFIPLSVGIIVGVGGSRVVALTEDSGRAPFIELGVRLWFILFSPKYYTGSYPVQRFSPEEKRLKAMIAAEHELAGEETEGPLGRFLGKMKDAFAAIRRSLGR